MRGSIGKAQPRRPGGSSAACRLPSQVAGGGKAILIVTGQREETRGGPPGKSGELSLENDLKSYS